MIGGMVIQVLIQAALLQLSLKLIAKHEADTTFSKSAMVTAGIIAGNFVLTLMVAKVSLFLVWPAQIAFTAAVIMTFCWISFWKSLVVVIVFVTVQVIFALVMALILGISVAGMLLSGPGKGGASKLDYKHPLQIQSEAQQAQAEAMMQEAEYMRQQAMQKQAQIEAEARRMEMEGSTPTPPAEPPPAQPAAPQSTPPEPAPTQPGPTNTLPAVQAPQVQTRPQSQPYQRKTTRRIDWEAARKSLRMGGIVATPDGYLAQINGKMLKQGQTVDAQYNGHQYRWTIKSLSKTDIDLEQVDVK